MKKILLLISLVAVTHTGLAQPGKYAGTKKSLLGKSYSDSRNIEGLQGWEFQQGSVLNELTDPEMITVDVFKKGTTYIIFFSIKEDTASDTFVIHDVLEVKGVVKGWQIMTSFCRKNKQASTYIVAWVKNTTAEYFKTIKKAWKFNRDKRRIEVTPVKGIDCENIGC